jgi:hypothetical protein
MWVMLWRSTYWRYHKQLFDSQCYTQQHCNVGDGTVQAHHQLPGPGTQQHAPNHGGEVRQLPSQPAQQHAPNHGGEVRQLPSQPAHSPQKHVGFDAQEGQQQEAETRNNNIAAVEPEDIPVDAYY